MGINSNLNGDDDHMIQLETQIGMIFDAKDDNEVFFHGFTAQNITAATANMIVIYIFINYSVSNKSATIQ